MGYSDEYKPLQRCDEVANWFKKFQMDFSTLYFNEPDHTGHSYGPNSVQYKEKVKNYYNYFYIVLFLIAFFFLTEIFFFIKIVEMDTVIGYLLQRLREFGFLDKMNVVIVSDHGMADMLDTIIVSKFVDMSLIDTTKTIFGIVSNIYPKNDSVVSILIQFYSTY